MLTEIVFDTLCVLIVNVALLAPAGTVTLVGTVASELLLLVSVTTTPPDGAGEERVAVPVTLFPPLVLDGLRVMAESDPAGVAGSTVSTAVCVRPEPVAVIVTLVGCVTAPVVTLKVAAAVNCDITTDAGTLATEGSLLLRVKVVSLDTVLFSLTRPLDPAVPVTDVGLSVSDSAAWPGFTVSLPCTVVPFRLALIVTTIDACTGLVATLMREYQLPG